MGRAAIPARRHGAKNREMAFTRCGSAIVREKAPRESGDWCADQPNRVRRDCRGGTKLATDALVGPWEVPYPGTIRRMP